MKTMPHTIILVLALLSLYSISTSWAGEFEEIEFHDIKFKVWKAHPSEVELFWKDPETGKPFRRLSKVHEYLNSQGRKIKLIMNAGIFEPDGTPTGLHVENGVVLNPLNEKDGNGNFYFKPNGVFFIGTDGKAAILETSEYKKTSPNVRTAFQAGPLLLNNGQINSRFNPDSNNRRHRNGIGVDAQGNVILTITLTTRQGQKLQANFHDLASLFLQLGCKNALFLDGDVSRMLVEPKDLTDQGGEFGAIIAISEKIQ